MNLQVKHVIVSYVIAALVVNPAMAQQQSAGLMKQQQMQAAIERLSVDRQSALATIIELNTTGAAGDPALKEALNGTTLVDIAAPSAKGVSKNNWNEFNVGAEGIIFNNSAAPVLTQLGGWADGNRRLAGGEASIILNQVNGANRSNLLGAIEVAGKSAEFILANPNGITCNGCGFINTPSVSLITGQSRLSANGDLTFEISGGNFLLEGAGLNATNVDRFDIVSRYAQLNANLYAKNVNVMTGVNEFNYQTKALAAQESPADSHIQFAFDTTALGGMYANTIKLVGTEKGLGINLQGLVQSTQDLEITADGNLQIKQLQANNQLTAKSLSGSVKADEFIYASSLDIQAAEKITNNGFMAAKDQATLSADTIEQSGNLYVGLDEKNQLNNTANLTLTANRSLINTGDFYVGGQLNLATAQLTNQGVLVIQSAAALQAENILNNNTIQFNAQNVNLTANTITNSGDILHLGNGLLNIDIDGNINNVGVWGTNGNLNLQAVTLNNQGILFANDAVFTLDNFNNENGELESAELVLNAQSLINSDGRILALGNSTSVSSLNISGSIDNKDGVFYADTGTFLLSAADLDNTAGNFIINNNDAGTMSLAGQINNQNGFFQANQLDITALDLNNNQGDFLTSILNGKINTIDNNSGFIQAGRLTLHGDSLDNTSGVILSTEVNLTDLQLVFGTQILNQNNAVIRNLNGDIQLTTANFINTNGLVDASRNGGIILNTSDLNNYLGSLAAKNTIQFSGASLNNTQGYIEAGLVDFRLTGDLMNTDGVIQAAINLDAKNLINNQGYLLLDGNADIQLTGELQNIEGVIATWNDKIDSFSLKAQNIENTGELFFNASNADITSGIINNTGLFAGTNRFTVNATDLFNKGGLIDSGELTLNIDNQLTNTSLTVGGTLNQGQISANSITLSAQTLLNDLYALIYADQLTANSTIVENKGFLIADQIDLQGNTFTQTNTGEIVSASNKMDSLVVNFLTSVTNAGQISRNNDWSIKTVNFVNNGRIESLGNGDITAQKIVNTDAQKIVANANLDTVDIDVDNGLIFSENLTLNAAVIDNQQGILIVNNQQDNALLFKSETGSVDLNNQQGLIQFRANNASWNNISLNNRDGGILHLGLGNFNLDLFGNLDNTAGTLVSDGNLILKLNNANSVLTNNAGLILANDIDITAADKIDNINKGTISGANLTLTANVINNNGGVIEANAADQVRLALNAQVNNTNAGEIRSNAKDWNMVLDAINNEGGSFIHTGSGTFSVKSSGNFINKGVMDSANHLSLDVAQLQNDGQLSAANQLSLTATNGITNSTTGVIGSTGADANFATQLNAANQQINNQGYWFMGNQLVANTENSDFLNSGDWIIGELDGTTHLLLNSLVNTGDMVFDSVGNLVIDANNKIVNSGQIFSEGQLNFSITGPVVNGSGFTNDGLIQTKQLQLHLDGKHNVTNSDTIVVSDSLQIGNATANFVFDNSGVIQTGNLDLQAEQFTNTGNLIALDKTKSSRIVVRQDLENKNLISIDNIALDIEAQQFINNGRLVSAGDISVSVDQLTNQDQQKAATNQSIRNLDMTNDKGVIIANNLSLVADTIDNTYGVLLSQSNTNNGLTLTTNNTGPLIFDNTKGFIQSAANNWTLDNLQLTNNAGALLHLGTGSFNLDLFGNLDNTAGTLVSDGNLILKLNNANSVLTNNAGLILANDIDITASDKIDNINKGIISGANLALTASVINNNTGVIEANAADQARLTLNAQVNNINSGEIRSGAKDWNMVLDAINNEGGSLIHTGSGTFSVKSSGNFINKGVLDSANHLSLDVAQLQNDGQLSAANQLSITGNNGITNTGLIGSSGNNSNFTTQLNATNQQINNQGYWFMGNQLIGSIAGSDFINSGQWIIGDGSKNTDINLSLKLLINSGNISYNNSGNFIVNADKIENQAAAESDISAVNGGLQFNLTGTSGFTNNSTIVANRIGLRDLGSTNNVINNGRLQANQFTLQQVNLTNNGTLFGANLSRNGVIEDAIFTLTGTSITNKGIWINQANNWALGGKVNGDGTIYHAGSGQFSLALDASSDLTGAYIETGGELTLSGIINGGETTKINAEGNAVNQRTTLVAEKNITITGSTPFTNNGVKLVTNQDMIVNTSLINKINSTLSAQGQLRMSAVAANPAIDITNAGSLQAGQLLVVANRLDNTNGNISIYSVANTAKESNIKAANLINENGSILVSNLNKNAAALDSLSIDANSVNNKNGLIGLQNTIQAGSTWVSQTGNNKLKINAMDWVTDNTSVIFSDGDLDLSAKGPTTYVFDNNGNIQALGDIYIDAYAVENNGSIIGAGSDSSFEISSFSFENRGEVFASNDLIIHANLFNNNLLATSSVQAVGDLRLNLQSLNINRLGRTDAGNLLTLNINSDVVINQTEKLISSGALSIVTAGKITNAGEINTKNHLLLDANILDNQSTGRIISGAGLIGFVPERGGNYFQASTFTIANDINNAGIISSKGDLNINTSSFSNVNTGRVITGQHQLGGNAYSGNLSFNVAPAGQFSNNGGVVYSYGDLNIKNAGLISNNTNGQLIALQNMNLQGVNLQNSRSRIEAQTGDITLDFSNSILNESSLPTLTEDAKAYGYSLFSSAACNSDGSCEVDERVTDVCNSAEDCGRYEYNLSLNDPGAIFRKENYDRDRDRSSIWNGIAVNRGMLTYTYTASISSGEYGSIVAGRDIKITNANTVVQNNYGNIYAGRDLEINGRDLLALSREFHVGSALVYIAPARGDCASTSRQGAACSYSWNFMLPASGLEIFNYGAIRAGGNITGTLSGRVVNAITPAPAGVASQNAAAETGGGFTGGSELKNYLDQALPDQIKNNFYTNAEKVDVNAADGNAESATKLDTSSTGSGGSSIDELITTVNVQGIATEIDPLTAKTLDDIVSAVDSVVGVGSQTSEFTGEAGDKPSIDTSLLDQADQQIAETTAEIPELIAKATTTEFKTNQWPLISFNVLPFNFDLKNLSGLYVVSQNPDSDFLIETRPEFTEYGKFLGSDYLLDALGYNADQTIKRLGDAFFENQLIRDALIRETNSTSVADITSDYELMQTLMDNAVAAASKLQLSIGVALTPEQSAALTQDMMWLVKKKINGQEVFVPHLYLTSVSPDKIAASKAAMAAGGNLALAANSIENQSSINANNLMLVTRGNLQQDGRLFAQGDVRLLAGGDVTNSGSIQSNNMLALAQGDVTNTAIGRITAQNDLWLESTKGNTTNTGTLKANNLTLKAAVDVEQVGNLQTKNNLALIAGQDVLLKAQEIRKDANNVNHVVSNLTAGGNLLLDAGRDIQLQASDLNAGGNINLHADRDVNLQAVKNETHAEINEKRKKVIDHTVTHDLVNIKSGGNVSIDAGQDANLMGTNVIANGAVRLAADRDVNMSAVVDSDYHFDQTTKKKSFGRKKTTTNETLTETVKGGLVMGGGDVMINAHRNENGEIITEKSGKVNLLGTTIMSGVNAAGEVVNENADVIIAGDEDVNISGIAVNSLDFHQTKKKSFGGLNKTDQGSVALDQLLENALVSASGDVHLISNNNLNLIAADVSANGDINMEAVDQLLIAAGEAKSQTENWKNSSGLFTSNSIYSKKEYKDGQAITAGQASNINARGDVRVNAGSGKIIGSNIVSGGNVYADADMGNIEVTSFQGTMESFQYEKEISVGLGDLANAISRPDQLIQNKDGRLTMKVADATYDEVDTKTKIGDNQKSTIQSNGDITLISRAGEVNLGGSDLTANADKQNGGNVNLAGAMGVNIDSATNTQETQTKEVHGSAEMSVVVQHQAVEVVKAVIALDEAKDKLEGAKQQYKDYQRNLSDLERQLDQLEGDVKNKVPGVSFDDLVEMRELLEDVKNDEDFMKAGVALAAINVATATTTVIQQTAAAAASTGTWGFNAGVQLDIAAQKDTTTSKTTTAQASNIMGNQIRIETGTLDKNGKLQTENTAVNINGSNLIATQNEGDNCGADCESTIRIRTGDLNLTASKNTSETSNEHQEGNITAQMTVYGASGGASVSGSYSQSKSTSKSTEHNNTQLRADIIDLTTSGDLNILGANVDANKHLEVDVAGDMTVESKQNRSNSRNAGFSVSGGMGFGGDNTNNSGNAVTRNVQGADDLGAASSGNIGIGVSNGSMSERQTVLSTLTSGGTANINVDGHTQNTGALIATVDKDGKDLGKLNFTTGSYDFADLRNNYINSQTNLNASTSFSVGGDNSNPRETQTTAKDGQGNPLVAGMSNVTGAGTDQVLARENNQSKTLATLGHGNITVGGVQLEKDGELTEAGKAEDSSLFMANRDTTAINKSLVNSQYDLSVNVSIDTRLFTESGRDAIAEDAKKSKDFGKDIWITGAQILENKDLNALHYMSTLDTNAKATQVINEVTKNEQLVAALKSDDAATQAAAQDQVAKIAQQKFGLTEEEIADLNFYDGDKTTSTSLAFVKGFSEKMGGVVVDKNSELAGTIHIMANDKENMLNTVGQEVLEKVTYENGSSNNAAQEARTEILGSRLAEGINKASGGSLNATSGANFVADFKNSDLVIAGTERANAVGSAQVDNRQLHTKELDFINNNAKLFASEQGITTEEAKGILTKQALAMVDARWKKRLADNGFTGDEKAQAFLEKHSESATIEIGTKEGNSKQGMFTVVGDQHANYKVGLASAYEAETGFYTNHHYNPNMPDSLPINTDLKYAGHLVQYALDGKVSNMDVNFINETTNDMSGAWNKTAAAIEKEGWNIVPKVAGAMYDVVVNSPGKVWDACAKSLNCLIPNSSFEGSPAEQAYFDRLYNDPDAYSDNMTKGFWEVGIKAAELASMGVGTGVKKVGTELSGEVINTLGSGSKNYYQILNVAEDASPTEIKNAYRRAASENHPDRNPDPQATTKMQEINEAYDALSGKSKRPADVVDTSSPDIKRNSDTDIVPAGTTTKPASTSIPKLPSIVTAADIKSQAGSLNDGVKQSSNSNNGSAAANTNSVVGTSVLPAVINPNTAKSVETDLPNVNVGNANIIPRAEVRNTPSNISRNAANTQNATDLLNQTRNSLVITSNSTHPNFVAIRMDVDTDPNYLELEPRNLLDEVITETTRPLNTSINAPIPDHVWPQPYPPLAEGATRIAEIERIKTNQVTGAFQGEVKNSIVERKMAEIQAILNSGPDATKQLPVVRMAPDPVTPGGLVLTDQTHTYAAYVRLGFDEIPASVYNQENGVPFLIKQSAYHPENYAPIDELRGVPEFTGSPSQQAAARRAEALEAQNNNQMVNESLTPAPSTADDINRRVDDPSSGKKDSVKSGFEVKQLNPDNPDDNNLSRSSVDNKNNPDNPVLIDEAQAWQQAMKEAGWIDSSSDRLPKGAQRYEHLDEKFSNDPYGSFYVPVTAQNKDRSLNDILSAVKARAEDAIDIKVPNPDKTFREIIESEKNSQVSSTLMNDPALLTEIERRFGEDQKFGIAGAGRSSIALSFIDANGEKQILRITDHPANPPSPASSFMLPIQGEVIFNNIRMQITEPVAVIGDFMEAGVESDKIVDALSAGLYRDGILFDDDHDLNFGMTRDGRLVVVDVDAVMPVSVIKQEIEKGNEEYLDADFYSNRMEELDQLSKELPEDLQPSAPTNKVETDVLDGFKPPFATLMIDNPQSSVIKNSASVERKVDREIYIYLVA